MGDVPGLTQVVSFGVGCRYPVVRVPRRVGRVGHLLGLVQGVVPKNTGITVDDAEFIVGHVHLRGVIYLAQADVDVFCVAHQGDGIVGGLSLEDLCGGKLHAVPQSVQRQAAMRHLPSRRARHAVQRHVQRSFHRVARTWLTAHKTCTSPGQLGLIILLPGQYQKLVLARGEVHAHRVQRGRKGGMPRHVGLFLFRHIPPFLVEDIHRDGTHMVVEHVGPLQVVVILKGEVQPCGAIVQVILHHRTGGRHGARRRQAAPRRKPFFHLIPHISLFFVQHSFLRSFSFLYIVGFAAHAAPPHGFLFRWANPCRFYAPARLVPGPAERPVSLPAEGPRPKGALPFLFLKKGGRKARRPHGLPLFHFIHSSSARRFYRSTS